MCNTPGKLIAVSLQPAIALRHEALEGLHDEDDFPGLWHQWEAPVVAVCFAPIGLSTSREYAYDTLRRCRNALLEIEVGD